MLKATDGQNNLELPPVAALTLWCLAPINQLVSSCEAVIIIVIMSSVGRNLSPALSGERGSSDLQVPK